MGPGEASSTPAVGLQNGKVCRPGTGHALISASTSGNHQEGQCRMKGNSGTGWMLRRKHSSGYDPGSVPTRKSSCTRLTHRQGSIYRVRNRLQWGQMENRDVRRVRLKKTSVQDRNEEEDKNSSPIDWGSMRLARRIHWGWHFHFLTKCCCLLAVSERKRRHRNLTDLGDWCQTLHYTGGNGRETNSYPTCPFAHRSNEKPRFCVMLPREQLFNFHKKPESKAK